MKYAIFLLVLWAGATAPADNGAEQRMSLQAAADCDKGGGCYAIPKAAVEKMRGLILEYQRQIDVRDEEINKLRSKMDRSCA